MLIDIGILPTTLVLLIPVSIGRIQGFIALLYLSLLLGIVLEGGRELGVVKARLGGDDCGLFIHDRVLIP